MTGPPEVKIPALLEAIDAEYERLEVPQWLSSASLKPAGERELAAAETELGFALPADYRVFLLQNQVAHNFDGNFRCLSLGAMMDSWRIMKTLLDDGVFDDGRVEHIQDPSVLVWWSTGWLPFAEDSCGNMRCLNLGPGSTEEPGQLVYMEVQDGQGPFSSEFPIFTAFLANHLHLLKNNKVVVEDGWLEVDSYR